MADPTIVTIPVRAADNSVVPTAAVYDGTRFFPGHFWFGWTGTTYKALSVDNTGALTVSVNNLNQVTASLANVTHAQLLTPGTPVTPGLKVLINCTAEGNIRFKMSDATTIDVYVYPRMSELTGYSIVDIDAANTTATAVVKVMS